MTRLAVLPGDGIGPEVVTEAVAVLAHLDLGFDIEVLDHIRAERYLERGSTLEDADLDRIGRCDALLVGALGDPRADARYARGVLLRLRTEFDLYVNLRPVRLLHDRLSPLRNPSRRAIDCRIIRENTEGAYVGVGGHVRPGSDQEIAIDVDVNTHHGVRRVLEYAFAGARREVCMVDKANAVPHGGGLWQRCWTVAAARYPRIAATHLYADVAAMHLVGDPTRFDTIVTNNAHGDLLSDVAAQVAGGLGTAASANLNPDTGFGLYEPVHGSAPDIAGCGVANPVGAVLSTALLLDHLGLPGEAGAVRAAVASTVAAGRCTRDIGGYLSTADAGAAIRAEI